MSMINIPPILQTTTSDCGKACMAMVLKYYNCPERSLDSFPSAVDGMQVRTIESYFRERGFCVMAGNFNYGMLSHFISKKCPVICLIEDHYVVVKGIKHYRIHYNCPMLGEKCITATHFKRIWLNETDGSVLFNWAIAAYK